MYAWTDLLLFEVFLGKVPQRAVWFWGGLDFKPFGLRQLLLQVSLCHVYYEKQLHLVKKY